MQLLLNFILVAVASAAIVPAYTQSLDRIIKRSICTVTSLDDTLVDDVPRIIAALKECGDTGTIIFPAGKIFNIRSPLDLSSCKRCQIQLDGTLKFSADWDYWQKQAVGITISSGSNIVITSSSADGRRGVIDGNDFGWRPLFAPIVPRNMPTLLRISNSSHVYVRNIQARNAPATSIHVSSESSAIHFDNVEHLSQAKVGYLIENAEHVYLRDNVVRATDSCFSIRPNTTNLEMTSLQCNTYYEANVPDDGPNAIELRLSSDYNENWLRNIVVKNLTTTGSLNVVALTDFVATVQGAQWTNITNATISDVSFGTGARQVVLIGGHRETLTVRDVTFRNFRGGKPQYPSDLKCENVLDSCEFKQEGWEVSSKR